MCGEIARSLLYFSLLVSYCFITTAKTENLNRAFEDSFWKIHKKANKFDFNIKRLGNEPAWPS